MSTSGRAPARARTVSVVIPTLNEASHLPVLLSCLAAQTRQPDEIIVADADSTDDTVAVALARGVRVVPGGMPGAGRNAGAAASTGDLIWFSDADAEPEPTFLERALAEIERRHLDLATAPIRATENVLAYKLGFAFSEFYMRALKPFSPHAVGICLLITRQLHDHIGGFDETLMLGEDHDYARRAAKLGKFGILWSVQAHSSQRRIESQGRKEFVRVLVWSEWQTLRGRPIRELPFEYHFGVFENRKPPKIGETRARAKSVLHAFEKPSTELQGDAIGVQVASVVAGGLGVAALAATGAQPATYLPVAGVAATAASLSGYAALRKLKYERRYGDYFSSSVAVASADIVDADGTTIVRAGVDEIAEIHVMGQLGQLGRLSKEGVAGRVEVILTILRGFRAMINDFGDEFYENVTYVVVQSDLTTFLFKVGFDEIPEPPQFDFINRLEKRLLMWRLTRITGREHSADTEKYRMAVMTKDEFMSAEFAQALDAQIARVERMLAKAQERGAEAEAKPQPE